MNRAEFQSIWLLLAVVVACGGALAADPDGATTESDGTKARSRRTTRQASPPDPELLAKLRAPMVTAVQGQSFRAAAEAVARRAGVNLWIDRGVDPSAPIDLGHAGETVFDVLRQVASIRGCEVHPVRNVVLVGRPGWLDHTADAVLRLPPTAGSRGATPNRGADRNREREIAWPDLTTPEQAFRIVSGDNASPGRPLPHDLWPAVTWRDVDREVARTLVVTQCDAGRVKPTGRFEIRYRRPARIATETLRAWEPELRLVDGQATVTLTGRSIAVEGSVTAHRVATRLLIQATTATAKSKAQPGRDPMKADTTRPDEAATEVPRFTLRLKNQPAGQILRELAATAGKECQIVSEARHASESLVSLEAEEMTLEQLAAEVAAEVGLRTEWGEQTLVVRPGD